MKKIILLLQCILAVSILSTACKPRQQKDAEPAKLEEEVKIDLFVMSMCPHGVTAIDAMAPLVEKFKGQVGLNIEYIGNVKPDGTLTSMKGENEVQGNIDQLCAKETASDKAGYWKFLSCVNKNWREIPNNSADCAKEAGLNLEQFNQCKDGEKGKELFKASLEKAKEKNASGSPTIFINGEPYRGNRSEAALEQFICNSFGADDKIEYCKNIEPPGEVVLTVLTDKRCGKPCEPDQMIKSLETIFSNLKPNIMDWSDPKAQELAKAANITKLPAMLLGKDVEQKDKAGFDHMQKWLDKAGDYYSIKVRAEFDPTAEICDDGIDNTGNGLVDCDDPTCANQLVCRKETPKTLEVFVMSYCRFGTMAIKAMKDVLEAFKGDIDFKVNYIGRETPDGKINNMFGEAGVKEDTKWICAQKHYPKNYMDFLICRAGDIRNPDWQKCATGPMKAAVIEKCAEGDEGIALLKENIKLSNDLDIGGSPTWIANGRHRFSGVTPKAIQDNFCQVNEGLKGCETPLSNAQPGGQPGAPAPAGGSCGG